MKIPARASHVYTTSEVREQLPALFRQLERSGQDASPIFMGPRRKPVSVLLSYESYAQLLDFIDDVTIVAQVIERDARDTGETIALEDAAKELGVDLDSLAS